ncbi:type I pullulanase [Streptococcus caprae]|uniref:pullulanase n=1 Tax=Streptococcus caprae TaxID=1640501 RepID=A0ABV8CSH3_9STRE
MENTVLVHVHSQYTPYFDLSLWQWQEGQLGRDAYFQRYDSFGAVATLTYPSEDFLPEVYLMLKTADWSKKSVDFQVRRNSGIPKTEVWLVDGDDRLYYSRQAAVTSHHYSHRQAHAFDMAVASRAFDRKWAFDGWFGFRYQPSETTFRVWAPTAERVELIFYSSTDERASVSQVYPMVRGQEANPEDWSKNTQGVWSLMVPGDWNFQAYAYRIYYRKRTYQDTRDPYTIATVGRGRRSIVIAEEDLRPAGFSVKHGIEAPWRLSNPNRAVIAEIHIRDFSKSETSGVSAAKRGKFLGAIETGTVNAFGDKTCFDYLKESGYNYIQLQPIFDHHQIIEADGSYKYNWGYDPENYNVPEASFTSNPLSPTARIHELKQVIQAYHDAGIGVIMDVVYNHTFSSLKSPFQRTVPDYFYRMNVDGSFQDGTGCGNETASEKAMFRKYMLDSIRYWVTEYNVDGFRFDLMGLHDVETMNLIRQELDKIDPRILIYGEGWDMGTGLAPEQKAKKQNATLLPGIGFFNDDQRNAVKGAEVYGYFKKGFVSGAGKESKVAKAILGSDELNDYLTPSQVVNYVEAHDNYNLNDLLLELHPDDSQADHVKRVELATGMNLLMQGICFMELGQEFMRTKLYPTGPDGQLTWADKERAMNSYNAPDEVNQIDWNLVTTNRESVEKTRTLMALKRENPLFSLETFAAIREQVFIESAEENSGVVNFKLGQENGYHISYNSHEKNLKISMTDS